MGKKLKLILSMTLIFSVINVTCASAKILHSEWTEELIKSGYAEDDALTLIAIVVSGKENVIPLIEQKCYYLGGWRKTAEYYGIDEETLNEFIKTHKFYIPDNIYKEMVREGMTDKECIDFLIKSSNALFDVETTWQARKDGITISELLDEKIKNEDIRAQAATDFIFGKITATEYTEIVKNACPYMSADDILQYAEMQREHWTDFRRATSGITDDEVNAALKAGITDFFTMCKLKDTELMSNKTFGEMLEMVKNGQDAESVIQDSISQDKIKKMLGLNAKEFIK